MKMPNVRILLLEDYVDYAQMLRSALQEVASGFFDLHCETRLSDALATLDQSDFDLILLDLDLPDSSGLHTLLNVIPASKDVPIIVLTGINDETLGEAAVKAGAEDYLVKTQTNGQRLWRVIRYAIERNRLKAEHKEAERLRVLCETAGAAAHEINQPLTAIVGYADLVLDSLPADHPKRKDVLKIKNAGMVIQGIVKQMQNVKTYVTKPYLGDMEIVDFVAASQLAVNSAQNS